jgi:hypothetical protein
VCLDVTDEHAARREVNLDDFLVNAGVYVHLLPEGVRGASYEARGVVDNLADIVRDASPGD